MDMMMYSYDHYIRGATTTFSAVDRFVFHLCHWKFKEKKKKVFLFCFLQTVHGYTSPAVVLDIRLVLLRTKDHNALFFMHKGIICHVHLSSEKYSNGRLV